VMFCACGQPTLPHRVCAACGSYRGRKFTALADGQ
jgi:large subunit ribosomal protein L32